MHLVSATSRQASNAAQHTGARAQISTAHSDSIRAFEPEPVITPLDSSSSHEGPPKHFNSPCINNDICFIAKRYPTSMLEACDQYPDFSGSLTLPGMLTYQAPVILKQAFVRNTITHSNTLPGAAEYPALHFCCWNSLP